MKTFSRGTAWVLTVVGGMFLGASALVWSQPKGDVPQAVLKTPNDLSLAFREASKRVLPAVVSIKAKTNGSMQQTASGDENPLEGSPFADDEFLRRFFGEGVPNTPRGRNFRRYTPPQMGAGSGVIVDETGVVLTNSHVVSSADEVTVELADGREFKAESWATDPRRDIAIVKFKADGELPTATLGDSESMEIGDWVLALGNPFNVGTTVTAGIVSAKGRDVGITEFDNFIQTDAAVNPGNSGGPLINLNGEIVGINTAISTNSGGYDGVSFAIPINMVRGIVKQLIETGEVQRSYLGVGLQPLTKDLQDWYKTKGRALVTLVKSDSPASKAGIKVGDVIVKFAGEDVASSSSLTSLVEGLPAGKAETMVVLRDGESTELSVTPEEMPAGYTPSLQRSLQSRHEATPEEKTALGLQVGALTDEMREQLSIPDDTAGVVVKGVDAGSAAEEAGLRRGNVIATVNGEAVSNPAEFEEKVKSADPERGVLLRIVSGENAAMIVVKPES